MGLGPGGLLMVLIAEQQRPDLEATVRALAPLEIEFFGGLFPGLIHGKRRLDRGALLVPLPAHTPPLLVTGLDQPPLALPEFGPIAESPPGAHTAVILVDGLTPHVSRLLADLHGRLGNSVHYIGGGAGSLAMQREPCVFTRAGVFQDAAVISFLSQRSHLGVRHGWRRHHGPVVATRTRGNVIYELNWETAFDVYSEALEPSLGSKVTREGFQVASTGFPFGIYKEGGEDVVRDPIAVGGAGELICVGEVPENAVLNILHGDRASLIEAAAQAASDCCAAGPVGAQHALVFDCVSRALFLGDDFEQELAAVYDRVAAVEPRVDLLGILTLGEISCTGQGYVEFYNKTVVVTVLHD